MRFLPGVLKEFVKHVPTVLFEVTDWADLASELPKLSKKILQKEGWEEILHKQQEHLEELPVKLSASPLNPMERCSSKNLAETFLRLYFAQLYSPYGIFIDMRLNHFEAVNQELKWHPNGFWVKFHDTFKEGLLDIYQGFYFQNEEQYIRGLINAGLMNEAWTQSEKDCLANLFKEQFGSSLHQPITFSLTRFKDSMMKIADFLLEQKVKISKDFLYLGLYLIALYSVLEDCQEPIMVNDIFKEINSKYSEVK